MTPSPSSLFSNLICSPLFQLCCMDPARLKSINGGNSIWEGQEQKMVSQLNKTMWSTTSFKRNVFEPNDPWNYRPKPCRRKQCSSRSCNWNLAKVDKGRTTIQNLVKPESVVGATTSLGAQSFEVTETEIMKYNEWLTVSITQTINQLKRQPMQHLHCTHLNCAPEKKNILR